MTPQQLSALTTEIQQRVMEAGADVGEAFDVFKLALMGAAMEGCQGNKNCASATLLKAGDDMAAKVYEWDSPRIVVPERALRVVEAGEETELTIPRPDPETAVPPLDVAHHLANGDSK